MAHDCCRLVGTDLTVVKPRIHRDGGPIEFVGGAEARTGWKGDSQRGRSLSVRPSRRGRCGICHVGFLDRRGEPTLSASLKVVSGSRMKCL